MQPERYEGLARNEDIVWWHLARRAMAERILRQAGMPTGGVALDIGCGTGGTFELFERLGCAHGVGVDLADDALPRRPHPATGSKQCLFGMAGAGGFEPPNAGTKNRCLNHLATPQQAARNIGIRARANNALVIANSPPATSAASRPA